MNQSQAILNQFEAQGASIFGKMASMTPDMLGNYMKSAEYQQYEQAKRDFVNANLRRESGAVITQPEFANADQQYFPQPGDGPEVIAQKRANRDAAIAGVKIGAGQQGDAGKPPPGFEDIWNKY